MKIAIATDHRGFAHKEFIKTHQALAGYTIEWIDFGAHCADRSDYPEFAKPLCRDIQQNKIERGVLLCGSGVGMSVVANRYQHIYAALVWNESVARSAAQEDKANVLVLPADYVTKEQAVSMISAWLSATFKGGRYQERIEMIDILGGVK